MLDLLLADGRTPTGGFAHSGGLEPMTDSFSSDTEEKLSVVVFVAARLRTVGLLDAAVAARAAAGEDPIALDAAWAARTPAAALREVARRQGRALLRLALRLWPARVETYAAASASTPRPVVLGLAAGLAPAATARLSLYEDAAAVCSAAPKLLHVDALDAAAWLAGCEPLIDDLAQQAAQGPLPAPATPLLDLRAQAHANDDRRLFVS